MDYTLIRSRRKTLAIEITREARLLVRAPLGCPQRDIDRFLAEKQDWIAAHTARMQARREAHPEPSPEQESALRRQAREVLPPLVNAMPPAWACILRASPSPAHAPVSAPAVPKTGCAFPSV